MSIIFFGTPDFAVPSLRSLLDRNEKVIAVVTQPDRRAGRGRKFKEPPVKILARSRGINVLQPGELSYESLADIFNDDRPEMIIVVAYGKILPSYILELAEKGCINVHASLLPKYRGAAPIQWALINGEEHTGITTMLMDKGMDTGDILLQSEVAISEDDNYGSLSEKLSEAGAELLIRTVDGIRAGTIGPRPQQGDPSYAPSLKKSDGRIDWNKSASSINSLVKGLYPWPCAFTFLKGKYIKIHRTAVQPGKGSPGRVESVSLNKLLVGTSKDLLSVEIVQPEGKRPADATSFINGYRVSVGDILG